MSEEPITEASAPAVDVAPLSAASAVSPARRGGGFALLLALLALIVAGAALWRGQLIGADRFGDAVAQREALEARIDALAQKLAQRGRDLDGLRARLADADGVNRSVREELLALGERSRHLEDAVANQAQQRLSGRDALARNEAEFLLQLGGERLQLFHDAEAALAAYRLADSALASTEDPVFAQVRATIGAEIDALAASRPQQTQAGLAALERLRARLSLLPPPRPAPVAEVSGQSRWRALFDRFVSVRREASAAQVRGSGPLDRSLIALDLREAEAALLARDRDAWSRTLASARSGIVAAFDGDAPSTREVLGELDRLAATPLAPTIPELGAALRELRNLRVMRALAAPPEPAAPEPKAVEPPAGDDA